MPVTNTPFQRAMQLSCQHIESRIFYAEKCHASKSQTLFSAQLLVSGVTPSSSITPDHSGKYAMYVSRRLMIKSGRKYSFLEYPLDFEDWLDSWMTLKCWRNFFSLWSFRSCVSSSSSCWTGCSSDGNTSISGLLVMISSIFVSVFTDALIQESAVKKQIFENILSAFSWDVAFCCLAKAYIAVRFKTLSVSSNMELIFRFRVIWAEQMWIRVFGCWFRSLTAPHVSPRCHNSVSVLNPTEVVLINRS